MIKFLASERLSINHVFASGVCFAAIQDQNYIAAVIIFATGCIYCAFMESLSNKKVNPNE